MKIIIEEYQYKKEDVKDILWEGAFQDVDVTSGSDHAAPSILGAFVGSDPEIEPKIQFISYHEKECQGERDSGQFAELDK